MDLRVGFYVLFLALLGTISTLLVLPLLQYVMGAALLAFVLVPIHNRLIGTRLGIRGYGFTVGGKLSAGVVTVFAILAAILPLLFFTAILFRTVLSFAEQFRDSAVTLDLREIAADLGVDEHVFDLVQAQLLAELEGVLEMALQFLTQELIGLLNMSIQVGVGLLLFVFLLYYFLVDGQRLVDWIGAVAPLDETVRKKLFAEINLVTWAVMKSHVFVALIEGILGGIGLYLLGVPNAAFWTVVMIVVSFLPAIGIWLVWAPAVAFLALSGAQFQAGVLLVYGITVLSVVDNYMRAVLVDRQSGVHPAVVLVGVIGGIYLFGILGLFLGPVLLAVFKAGAQVFGEVYDPETTDAMSAESV